MDTVKLKFTRINVDKVDTRENVLEMSFFYEENGKEMKHKKNYRMEDDVDSFVNTLITEVKLKSHERNAVLVDDDDFLSYHMNILMDEPEPGITKEKISNTLKRFKDKIRGFRSLRSSENYIQHYNELIGLKSTLD